MPGAIILLDEQLGADALKGWQMAAADFANGLGRPVEILTGSDASLRTLSSNLAAQAAFWQRQATVAGEAAPVPMTSAPFVFRPDGRPDWQAMWTSFCDLALYGGPPHRGPDNPVGEVGGEVAAVPAEAAAEGLDSVAEIRRGIFETTRMFSEAAEPGWLAVSCASPRMAAWLCASIILENVDARCEGERLFVPAHASFTLKNQVKSVVTVVAKTHHYWMAHVAGLEAATAAT